MSYNYIMLSVWNNFVGYKILCFFLDNPNTKIHLTELSRKINVSKSSVSYYCENYYKEKILKQKKLANTISYYLDNDNVFVKSFKKSYFLSVILNSKELSNFLKINNSNLVSLILYGGFASGNYSEKSDIDLLVIYNSDKIEYDYLLKLEIILKKEINITKLSLNHWVKKLNQKDNFINSILKNNVCLWGAEINDF